MSMFKKIWRLFKVAKVLLSLNSDKFNHISSSLLSSPSPPRKQIRQFAHQRSLSNCIYDDDDDHDYYSTPEKNDHRQNEEVEKATPSDSTATTPSSIDSPTSEHFSSEEDIDKKANDFISKMRRQISLDVAYSRSTTPSPPLPVDAPISPESYFNQMKEETIYTVVPSPCVSPVRVKSSSLNIKYRADSPRMKRRPSLVVHRPMAITG